MGWLGCFETIGELGANGFVLRRDADTGDQNKPLETEKG